MSSKYKIYPMVLSAMFLAAALILPFLTAQIPQMGAVLCPMHLPVLLCGFFCGPWYALTVGFISPLLRFMLFGMPPILPSGIGMSFELATYGLVSGLLYQVLPKKKISILIALTGAMIAGRIVWGIVRVLLYGLGNYEFGWKAFISGALLNSVPGIIVQIILIPVIVMSLEKYTCKNIG